jgi:hypothetical protein
VAESVAGGAGAAFFRGGAVGFGAIGAGRCDLFVSGFTDGVRKSFGVEFRWHLASARRVAGGARGEAAADGEVAGLAGDFAMEKP